MYNRFRLKEGVETPLWVPVTENFFTIVFVLEFVARVMVFGWRWALTPMNFVDFVLVFVTGVPKAPLNCCAQQSICYVDRRI